MTADLGAGPETNERVARIMGWTACPHYSKANFGSGGGPVLVHAAEECDCKEPFYPEEQIGSIHGDIGGCPNFSGSPEGAAIVKDWLREEGIRWSMTHGPAEDGHDAYVSVYQGLWRNHIVAPEEPLALCRFVVALREEGVV